MIPNLGETTMRSRLSERRATTHGCTSGRGRLLVLLSGAAIAVTLTACASAEPPAEQPAPSTPATGSVAPRGVSGLIAAAQDGQLQVQSTDAQTTVRYTAGTAFSTTVTVDVSTLQVGDCVVAITDGGELATTITLTEVVDGECGVGGGFPGGGAPPEGGFPEGERPEGMPSGAPGEGGRPEGFPEGAGPRGFGGATVGSVTALATDSVTIETTDPAGEAASVTLSVTGETIVTTTVDGSAADIAVGRCVTAQGEADSTGGYDATSLTLSDPNDDGQCTGVGGMRGGFGQDGPGGGNG